jgi:hypothetical protein
MRIVYGTTIGTLVLWCTLLLALREIGFKKVCHSHGSGITTQPKWRDFLNLYNIE